MKVGVIIYHKNIYSIYDKRWVDVCLNSLRDQTYKDFIVYELCYSDEPEQLWEGSKYEHGPMKNHIFAMNHIKAVNAGYDLVSSNFSHVDENDQVIRNMIFHDRDIATELASNHNIIGHGVVVMTKGFWARNKYYGTDELGYEDLTLWKRAIDKGENIIVLPEILFSYRLHSNQTGRINPYK